MTETSNDTLWVALKHIDQEGDEFVGVYTTDDRAMAACEADYARDGYEKSPWSWVGTVREDIWWGGAKDDHFTSYSVTQTILDEW